jgi:DNA-directed RNA polymerase specialized sigma24 family protein
MALMQLDTEEYELIKNIIFDEKTIRKYAEILGIPFTTIQSRKEKILEKLRKFLKN